MWLQLNNTFNYLYLWTLIFTFDKICVNLNKVYLFVIMFGFSIPFANFILNLLFFFLFWDMHDISKMINFVFFSHLIFAVLDSLDDHLQNSVSVYFILENALHTFTSIFPLFCRLKPPKIRRRSWEVLLTWIFIAVWGQKQETRDIATCPFYTLAWLVCNIWSCWSHRLTD